MISRERLETVTKPGRRAMATILIFFFFFIPLFRILLYSRCLYSFSLLVILFFLQRNYFLNHSTFILIIISQFLFFLQLISVSLRIIIPFLTLFLNFFLLLSFVLFINRIIIFIIIISIIIIVTDLITINIITNFHCYYCHNHNNPLYENSLYCDYNSYHYHYH